MSSLNNPAQINKRPDGRSLYLIDPRALRFILIGSLLLFWEVAPRLEWLPAVMLAPLSKTLVAGISNFAIFTNALTHTVLELALALIIALSLGGVLGLVLGGFKVLRVIFLPIFASAYAIPLVILYPVLTVWIGIGPESKVIFGAMYGFFPMLLATAAGIQTVDKNYLLAARSMGATRQQLMLQILLPAALPAVLSGMRVGSAMTAIGVVVAEMVASTAGIGFLITQNRTMFNTAEVYFGVFLVLVLAGAIDWLIHLLERRTERWQPRKQVSL
jgi:NitT/TauT family transport system permease protein/taurine transport system permease protein